jgi:hypothetical protein
MKFKILENVQEYCVAMQRTTIKKFVIIALPRLNTFNHLVCYQIFVKSLDSFYFSWQPRFYFAANKLQILGLCVILANGRESSGDRSINTRND